MLAIAIAAATLQALFAIAMQLYAGFGLNRGVSYHVAEFLVQPARFLIVQLGNDSIGIGLHLLAHTTIAFIAITVLTRTETFERTRVLLFGEVLRKEKPSVNDGSSKATLQASTRF